MSTSPRRLGKYELLERLGQGGMAEVWKAFDTQLGRYVAIKLLHANLQHDPHFITRFKREAQLIASLRHPNIVQIHDFQVSQPAESDSPIAYMVMTYVEGWTLADYIASTSGKGKIPSPAEIVNLFASISLAIDYAHRKGMIHRDIKPANILLDKHNTTRNPMGEPILTDFGLARLLGTSASTLSATQLSTPLYTSPEQARGYPGSERSDLYSLGVILYEMVTGVVPFRGDTVVAVVTQHLNATPTPPSLLNPNIPPALAMVMLTALAKDPNARFSSASAMTVAIAQSLTLPVPEILGKSAPAIDPAEMPTSRLSPQPPLPAGMTPFLGFDAPVHGQPQGPSPRFPSTPAPTSDERDAFTMPASGSAPPLPGRSIQNPPTPASVTPGGLAETEHSQGAKALSPPVAPPPSSPVTRPPTPAGRRWRGLYTVLIVLTIVVLLGSGVGSYFAFFRNKTPDQVPASSMVGQAFFVSSGQFNPGSAQGIADQLEIDLQNIPDPQPGKSYYAWLLPDRNPKAEADTLQPPPQFTLPLLLPTLSVHHGTVSFLYKGTSQHDNLFSLTSRLLITEEDSKSKPKGPSADRSSWRYYAEIPQTPYGERKLSALDHIRHLFYKETKVAVLGLPGGLDIWLFRNTEKLMEWAVSARDDYNAQGTHADQMHAQFVRILDYLDGSPNVHIDVPGGTVLADPVASRVALLTVTAAQQEGTDLANNPPGYLDHIPLHLNGVVNAPDATPEMRKRAAQIIDALNNVARWLKEVRKYAQQLVLMDRDQLSQPEALTMINNLLTNATYAYIGQLNPKTNKVEPGVLQVHYEVQQLATLTITKSLPQKI